MASSPFQIRKAHPSEIPALTQLQITAFRGRALNDALFPPHLRVNPGDADELAFRIRGLEGSGLFTDPKHHHLVCVDQDERILGYADWSHEQQQQQQPVVVLTDEEKAARRARLPKSFDWVAAERIGREAEVLQRTVKDALGEEGFQNSWSLNAIAVDPAYQRKGVGTQLMAWGEERAAADKKNIWFLSSPMGAKMYRALGYEQVGAEEIMGVVEFAFVKRAA